MASGWLKIHRSLAKNELWTAEPFTWGQAWVDLLINANHADGSFFVRKIEVPIKRGQLGWSELTMAKRWKWSRGKVRRYLGMLEKREMIVQQTTRLTSIITICNYSTFQDGDQQEEQQAGQQMEQQAGQQADNRRYTNKNVKNDKKKKNINTPSESATADPEPPPEKPKPSKYKFEPHHEELAVRMSNPVKARFPSQKINLDEWADAVRKLQDIDGHTRAEIILLWNWVINHYGGNFSWAANCRTPMKLREKKDGLSYFEIISDQMLREAAPKGRGQNHPSNTSIEDQLNDRSWAQTAIGDQRQA